MKLISLLLLTLLLVAPPAGAMSNSHDDRLVKAVIAQNRGQVYELIAAQAALNTQGINKGTALIWAVYNKEQEIVEALIAAGADLNIQDESGDTALMWSIRQNDEALAKALINAGASLNVQNSSGNTALMYAAIFGRLDTVRLLTYAGADLNLQNRDGYTALMLLIMFKEPLEDALVYGSRLSLISKEGHTAFGLADAAQKQILLTAEKKQAQVFALVKRPFQAQALKEKDPTAYTHELDHVHRAMDTLKTLAQNHLIVNYVDEQGNSPLYYAVVAGNRPMVILLLARMFKAKNAYSIDRPNDKGFSPLDVAVLKAPATMLPLLFQAAGKRLPAGWVTGS